VKFAAIPAAPETLADEMLPQVYNELRRLAVHCLRRDRRGHTLQPTALVHEAYLRLVGTAPPRFESRTHFLNIAIRLMRQILVEYARRRSAARRGSGVPSLELMESVIPVTQPHREILALDEALSSLAAAQERSSRIIELRFFGGFTVEEIAGLLEISTRTVERDIKLGCAWLHRWMSGEATRA
jgi:RNA polymerase sigma factor (TIGR02999 family)